MYETNCKSLNEHCSDLALILNQTKYKQTYDWLMIASGIIKVDFTWNRFDKTSQKEWCRPAYEYDLAKENVTNKYINELTVFNYIWSAFESLCDKTFTKNQIRKIGKFGCVTKLIKEEKYFPILFFDVYKKSFNDSFKKIYDQKFLKFKKKNFINEIEIIYNLRNQFAHGDLIFPEDSEYSSNFKNPEYLFDFISNCSRMVLFYIQAIAIYKDEGKVICSFFHNLFHNIDIDDYYDEFKGISYIISRIHLQEIPETDKYFTLFNKYYYEI
jgi:hypothetical protein